VLELLDVGADDPRGLDALEPQLTVDLLDQIIAQSGHFAA
jgi:hypothetical protein